MPLRLVGITDIISTCDCCGRQNLKRTVLLTTSEDRFPDKDECKAYGTQCAATALKNAGTPGFKSYQSDAVIQRLARDAQHSWNSDRQDQLLKLGAVVWHRHGEYLAGDDALSTIERRRRLIAAYPEFK